MRNPRHSPAPSFATDVSAVARRLHALLMRARRIKCFCEGAKTMLFKGKREAGNAPTATFQRDAAPAAHRTSPCVATDVCYARSDVVRPLDARKTHQVFLRGRKNDVVQREKGRSKAHSARPMRCGFSREPARYDSPHPLNSPAHSAPKILLSVGRACPRPPQAGYARNVQSSTQK